MVRKQLTVKPSLARRVLWIVRDLVFLTADSLALAFVRPRKRSLRGNKPKVAIVAAHGIGDLVLLQPTLDVLQLRYPRSRFMVTLVCSSAAAEFARSVLNVDEIRQVDRVKLRRNLAYRLAIVRRLRCDDFAIGIQPNFNRDLLVEDSLIRAIGAPARIGSVGAEMFMPPLYRLLGDLWYSQLIPASRGVLHELERNAEFARNLDPQAPSPPASILPAPQPPVECAGYVLFVVGSSSPLKTWPLAHFQWVAGAVAERTRAPIVFCAGPDDSIRQPDLQQQDDPSFVHPIRQTSLSDLMALISRARLVVSNDSAATHLAAAYRIPSVCIVGGGIVGRYHPYPTGRAFGMTAPVPVGMVDPMPCFDCGWRCHFDLEPGQPAPCVAAVERADVLAAALELLQQPKAG
jgi:ADP-heptose:LPS heptosyltransferase